MPVDSTHPEYDNAAPLWQRMRDAVAGEDAIRRRGSEYLPLPPGLLGGATGRAYINYLSRARYPEAVAPAVEGMVGLMDRAPAEITKPQSVEYLDEAATPDGMGLQELLKRIRVDVSTVGRYALLVDVLEGEQNPRIACYTAESLINWRTDGERVTLAVLHEAVREPKADDPFVEAEVDQYRVCRLDEEGYYVVEVYRRVKGESGEERIEMVEDPVYPERRGQHLESVPLIIVGSRDLMPQPDAIPLLSVANKSLHYWRQYADLAQQLSLSAMGTTAYVTGVEPGSERAPTTVGPGTIWYLPQGAECGYMEISGSGIDSQREELDRIQREIATSAIQALGDQQREAESGEALRLRMQSQTATLASIATTTAAALERAIYWCAWWVGQDKPDVAVEQPTGFVSEQPDASLLQALIAGVERGQIPIAVLPRYLRRTEVTDMTEEEFLQWAAAAQALPADE